MTAESYACMKSRRAAELVDPRHARTHACLLLRLFSQSVHGSQEAGPSHQCTHRTRLGPELPYCVRAQRGGGDAYEYDYFFPSSPRMPLIAAPLRLRDITTTDIDHDPWPVQFFSPFVFFCPPSRTHVHWVHPHPRIMPMARVFPFMRACAMMRTRSVRARSTGYQSCNGIDV